MFMWQKITWHHHGRYKEKFDKKELPEYKKPNGSTVFQAILNSGGADAERIFNLALFIVKVKSKKMKIEVFGASMWS